MSRVWGCLGVGLVVFVVVLGMMMEVGVEGKPFDKEYYGGHKTNQWAVKLHPGADPEDVAKKHGLEYKGHAFKDVHVFTRPEHIKDEDHPHVSTHPHVAWAKNQLAKRRFKRTIANDPLYSAEWNLKKINIEAVWDKGYKGQEHCIAIVDDGLDWNHPEFKSKYSSYGSYDFNYEDSNPTPFPYDIHGTEAAGAACANANNSVCGVGIAPLAQVSGVRLVADYTTDLIEANALAFKIQKNDIFSCSWGPNDDGQRMEAPEELTIEAIEHAIQTGRDGKGTIYVWASGNGKQRQDSCAYDGYASNKYTIIVGAVDSNDKEPFYSEGCAALLAVAPSSGTGTPAITTASLDGQCRQQFGGTSAACPQVAGLVAVVLSARPELTWRDIQFLIATTSKKINSGDSDWVQNGAGLHHSHKFGFGLVDADQLVNSALTWRLLPSYVSLSTPMETPDNNDFKSSKTVTFTLNVHNSSFILEHLEVHIQMSVSQRGGVSMYLTSPAGTKSTLQEEHPDSQTDIDWTYVVKRTMGEGISGTWQLSVKSSRSDGTLDSWGLSFFGHLDE